MQMQLLGFVALWLLAVKVPALAAQLARHFVALDSPGCPHSPTRTHASQNVASADSKPKDCSEGCCEHPQQAPCPDKPAGDFSDYVHVSPLTPAEAAQAKAAPGA